MKKTTKLIMLYSIILFTSIQVSAVPIIGLMGSGRAWYNSNNNSWSCDPHWWSCSIMKMEKIDFSFNALRGDYVALDIDESDGVSVLCPNNFPKARFAKMFVNNQFIITSPIVLDPKMSEAINSRLKTKLKGRLALAPGSYKYVRVGLQIKLRNIKVIGEQEAIKKTNALGDVVTLSDWDGTIPGIFSSKNLGVFIPLKETNKMLETLNSTKGVKAEMVEDAVKTTYIRTTQQLAEVNISQMHEVTNTGPLNHVSGVNITCEGTCPNSCFTTVSGGGWKCEACDITGTKKCYQRIRGDYLLDKWNLIDFRAFSIIPVDEGSGNSNNQELKYIATTILGEAYNIKATELKVINKESYLLMLASDNTKSIILLNKLNGQIPKAVTTPKWIAYYRKDLKVVDKNISSLITKKNVQNVQAKKLEYIGHVTLLR